MIPFKDNIPSRRYPVITVTLILVNVTVFIYEFSVEPSQQLDFFSVYGLIPAKLYMIGHQPVDVFTGLLRSLITSMFLHGGFIHLLGNMWYLWIFGDNVEDRMGSVRFLFFYLLCGTLASMVHILFNLSSEVPSIGASGAVAGVLGAYLVSYPFARVLTLLPFFFIWVVELPAILVLGSWFVVQIFNGTASIDASSGVMGGIAWWAHVGGFLSGMLLIASFARRPVRRYYWE